MRPTIISTKSLGQFLADEATDEKARESRDKAKAAGTAPLEVGLVIESGPSLIASRMRTVQSFRITQPTEVLERNLAKFAAKSAETREQWFDAACRCLIDEVGVTGKPDPKSLLAPLLLAMASSPEGRNATGILIHANRDGSDFRSALTTAPLAPYFGFEDGRRLDELLNRAFPEDI